MSLHYRIVRFPAADGSALGPAPDLAEERWIALEGGEVVLIAAAADPGALDRWLEALDPAIIERGESTEPSDDDRIARFVTEVRRTEVAWGLYDETWARAPTEDGTEALPLWSRPEHAARCIAGLYATFTPRRIDLEDLCDAWLPGMQEDRITAVLDPTRVYPGTRIDPAVLLQRLRS